MASTPLFGYLTAFLKAMMYLGIFPWKFVLDDDSNLPTLKSLSWKTHLVVLTVNYCIWSMPFDIHFWYSFLYWHDHYEIPDESTLIALLMMLFNHILSCYGLPFVHQLHNAFYKHQLCHAYHHCQSSLQHYVIKWNTKKDVFLPLTAFLLVLLTFYTLAVPHIYGISHFGLKTIDDFDLLYLLYLISLIRGYLYYFCAAAIFLEVFSAWKSWIQSLKTKLTNFQMNDFEID